MGRSVEGGLEGDPMGEQESSTRDKILTTATYVAQARGYGGLSFRDLASDVGIKAASVYHYFPSKAELGAAVARRYWQDTASVLESMSVDFSDPLEALREYPSLFRRALENDNRMCMCSFMAAEYDDLPEPVRVEVQNFAEVNVAWLAAALTEAGVVGAAESEPRARSIFAAIAGAQLFARSRSNISLYDSLIDGYRTAGLLPA
jgi:TetR/AcrR family transcriptional repressor of nem operon